MPRSRAANDGPVDADQNEPGRGLRFNESLSWRAGSKIPTVDLLKRLQALSRELKDMEQEEADRDSLTQPAKELASSNLLQHKDAGVKAWTACCLGDMFRLCAPEAPFTASQLKDIFVLFIRTIIPALSDPHHPYNSQHLYLLQSLSQVKSIILLTDVPSSNQLVLQLFETCFDILSGPGDELSKNVEYNMTGILECMIDECQGLPPEVIDIILAQFLRADPLAVAAPSVRSKKAAMAAAADQSQPTLQLKNYSPAYNTAKNICNTCEDRMARYVSQYFSNVIMSSTSFRNVVDQTRSRARGRADIEADGSENDDEQRGPDEEGLKELSKAHRLLRELWKSSPGVLQNVIPQIEAELSAENVQLRQLATEAMGDMVAGIGAAGPPHPPTHDPAAYPLLTLESTAQSKSHNGGPLIPSSPQMFVQTHSAAYQSFLGRKNDKSPLIRSAWTTSIGRMLSTSAGAVGINAQDENVIAKLFAEMLIDGDEKVRIAAIQALSLFDLRCFIVKLGPLGGVEEAGSVLRNLTERAKDRKPAVRSAAILLMGKLWGAAYGDIAAGNKEVKDLIGAVPSKIFDALYINDPSVEFLVDKAVFESLLPIGYPILKRKRSDGLAHDLDDGTTDGQASSSELAADKIRTERLLVLVRDLDQKAKVAFLARMARPRKFADYMKALLKRCEDYNGGVIDRDGKDIKNHLTRLIEFWSKQFPESGHFAEDLWKFAKNHDRRSYTLLKFCMADDSDYRKVQKSMREVIRRLNSLSTTSGTMPDTLNALMYRISNLCYNKSHIHPIIVFSQTNEKSLGGAAHELLKEISENSPEAFKTHAQELCKVLEEQSPQAGKRVETGALDNLKALATFARRYPKDVKNDRKFLQALMPYALRGSPSATAKYAVSVIMSVTDKRDMYAKDIVRLCVDGFKYGSGGFMSRLAAMSQVMLLAYSSLEEEKDVDPVVDIAINQILMQNRHPVVGDEPVWHDEVDEECEAKTWALKILVNRLRFHQDSEAVKDITAPVYLLLNNLIAENGELSKKMDTPGPHKARLRLQAALLHLKLCTKRGFEHLLTPQAFNALATAAQDPALQVREHFLNKVKKYLGQEKLPSRFYTIIFLLAFEPTRKLRDDSITWVRARSAALAKAQKTTMEMVFARFLSLLAHHPDFNTTEEELENSIKYIMFFLKAVATEDNLSLLYHIAQRVKSVRDGINSDINDHLYYLSELAQAVIRQYGEIENWSMQAYGAKARLPTGLFAALPNQDASKEIATKQHLTQEFLDQVDGMVRGNMRSLKKRKSDSDADHLSRKRVASTNGHAIAKQKSLPVRKAKNATKTPKKRPQRLELESGAPSSERRRSGRAAGCKSYIEVDDSDDDAEMIEAHLEELEEEEQAEQEIAIAAPKSRQVSNGRKAKVVITLPEDSESDLSEPAESDEE